MALRPAVLRLHPPRPGTAGRRRPVRLGRAGRAPRRARGGGGRPRRVGRRRGRPRRRLRRGRMLDEAVLSIAPVTLGAGRPLFPPPLRPDGCASTPATGRSCRDVRRRRECPGAGGGDCQSLNDVADDSRSLRGSTLTMTTTPETSADPPPPPKPSPPPPTPPPDYGVLRWLVAATFIVILNETIMVNAIPRLTTELEVTKSTGAVADQRVHADDGRRHPDHRLVPAARHHAPGLRLRDGGLRDRHPALRCSRRRSRCCWPAASCRPPAPRS